MVFEPNDKPGLPPPPPRAHDAIPPEEIVKRGYTASVQLTLIAAILGLFVASILYRIFLLGHLMPWSVFFHGICAVLGMALVALGPKGSLADRLFIGTTIALLMAGTVAGEGAICVLMIAPFVYLVVAVVAYSGGGDRANLVLPFVFVASLASGLQPADIQQTSAVEIVQLDDEEIGHRLSATPEIPPVGSGLLGGLPGASFPQPVAFSGEGLDVGDQRSIEFTDGGQLVLEVTESEPGRVTFVPVSDTTVIANWARWRQATFTWTETPDGMNEVTLDVYYRRILEPGWYFGPIVDAGMSQATGHLLRHLVVAPEAVAAR